MKQCPNCGAQIADDSLFCTECGKQIPQDNVCPHCGASVNDGDSFCQNRGMGLSDATDLNSFVNDEDKKNGVKKFLPYMIGGFVLLMIIGYISSNGSSNGDNSSKTIIDSVSSDVDVSVNLSPKEKITKRLEEIFDDVLEGNAQDCDERYFSSEFKQIYNDVEEIDKRFGQAGEIGFWDSGFWDMAQDEVKMDIAVNDVYDIRDNEAMAKVAFKFIYGGETETKNETIKVLFENGKWVLDDLHDYKRQMKEFIKENKDYQPYDWLQGHWVYDEDNGYRIYRIHVVIEGNRIIQYRKSRSESTNPTFSIENGEIRAHFYKDMVTTYKIDPVRQSIDLGEGRHWMYKLGSDEEIRHRVGFDSDTTFFIKIANQLFRSREGKEIRFDENRKVYINDIYAGTLSIDELKSKEATVSYSGGECGEGKLQISTVGGTRNYLYLSTIPYDGSYSCVKR